jgi:Tat protein translocase TatB subunit
MLPLGTYEILVIVVVALAIIGPKDLPAALRTVFRVVRKAQGFTRDFRRGLEDLAKDSGLDEFKRDLQSATSLAKGDIGGFGDDLLGTKKLKKQLEGDDPVSPRSVGVDPAAGKSIGGSSANVPTDDNAQQSISPNSEKEPDTGK